MGSINVRIDTKKLFFDFRFNGKRCREYTAMLDNSTNRKKLEKVLTRIEAEITLGTFEYAKYFPNSPAAGGFDEQKTAPTTPETPLFSEFAMTWVNEMKIQWRSTHHTTTMITLEKYLNPTFGSKEVGRISKAEILQFRAGLTSVKGRKGASLSASRLNHIMNPLRQILNEAACRYNFSSPYNGIKSLKVPRTDVEPFSLEEVQTIINEVRSDFRNYFIVRFFTGMRTSEIDGLQWQHVDFERRKINIRQALVAGELIYTKNDGSFREIDMSMPVFEALQNQKAATGQYDFVFCSRGGAPLNHNNVTNRVWQPLLRHLGLRKRRPYQTRHTAATLWLGAGENPEWIARQMGHTTTEMLFRVYSRFVPNLTRRDGSAFERLIGQTININITTGKNP